MSDPVLDVDRLDAIASFDLLSDELRTRLDSLAAESARQLDMPAAMVSIVMDTAQFIAGSYGLPDWVVNVGGTPVEWSLCAVAVRRRAGYVVEDGTTDDLQRENPLVTEGVLRSYAGTPLRTSDGHIIGAHCVLDTKGRQFTPEQLQRLEALGSRVMTELEHFRATGEG